MAGVVIVPAAEVPTALVAYTSTRILVSAPIVHPSDDAKVFIETVQVHVVAPQSAFAS